ncbi:MAG: hypothetical protein AAFN93_08880 [Bacteroidota bacterium]
MDNLKDIWQRGEMEMKPAVLPKKLKYNRRDLAHRILGSLKFEYYGSIISTVITLPALLYLESYIISIVLVLFTVPILIHYKSFINQLKELHYEEDVHAYLKDLYAITKRFLKHYIGLIIVTLSLYPIILMGLFANRGRDISDPKLILTVSIMVIVLAIAMYIGYYIKYGRHFKKIKEMFEMLEED